MSRHGYVKNMRLDDELDDFDDGEYDEEGAGEGEDGLCSSMSSD